ncbi:MAG TPA: hypothetical protein PLI98_09455 [Candidatus Hydrogenedentes bacterium]|nr:hypothetical protein [Candidatus Hydrogenedentota bacterium]
MEPFDGKKNFGYEYPRGLDLRPGSEFHKKIVDDVRRCADAARAASAKARTEWRKTDNLLQAYVPLATNERPAENNADAPTTIIVPQSQAQLSIHLAHMAGRFIDSTLYEFEGDAGVQSMLNAAKLERVIGKQARWFKHSLRHMISFRDGFAYGVGAVAPRWAKKKRKVPTNIEAYEPMATMLRTMIPNLSEGDTIRYLKERVIHEGTDLVNIDPYNLLLDPAASCNRYQDGEWIGYIWYGNSMNLLSMETDPEYRFFNGRAVREKVKAGGGMPNKSSSANDRNNRFGSKRNAFTSGSNGVESEVEYVTIFRKIIPSEWECGQESTPEIWMMTVAADEIVVQFDALNENHGGFPIFLHAPETSGHDVWPVSGLSMTYGLQMKMDSLINLAILGKEASINGRTVLDPSVFDMDTVTSGRPDQLILLSQPLYGEGRIQDHIHTISTPDVGGSAFAQALELMSLGNEILGTSGTAAGDMSQLPDRPTQAGIQAAQTVGLGRLGVKALMVQEQMWNDLAEALAYQTLQFMQEPVTVSILGHRYEERLRRELGFMGQELTVYPEELEASFSVRSVDKFFDDSDTAGMQMVVERMLSIPEVAMAVFGQINVGGLFMAAARRMGFRNVHEYEMRVTPDEEVLAQQEAGNVIPMDEAATYGS